jgi:hypothetical protein
MRPGKNAASPAHVPDRNRAPGAVDVQLQPTASFEIERLEPVPPFLARETRPGIKLSVDQCRSADLVAFVDQRFDYGSRRRFDRKVRPTRHLLRKLKREGRATLAVQHNSPLARGRFRRGRLPILRVCIRRPALEVLFHRTLPANPARLRQAATSRSMAGSQSWPLAKPAVLHPYGNNRASNSSCRARRNQRLYCPGRQARASMEDQLASDTMVCLDPSPQSTTSACLRFLEPPRL